jgi:hypothetical protein
MKLSLQGAEDNLRLPELVALALESSPQHTALMRKINTRRLYDRPLRKDWLFWFTSVVLLGNLAATVASDPDPAELTLKLPFVLAIVWILFGLTPGLIRRSIRTRREEATRGS